MFIYDSPITGTTNDKLNRKRFAENLTDAMYKTDLKVGLNVAIYGSWGSGKSSIINMIIETVKEKYLHSIVMVKFNPWYYSSTGQLIQLFFESLSQQLATNKDRRLNDLVKAIDEYGAIVGLLGDNAKDILKTFRNKLNGNNLFDSTDMMKQHSKLEKLLAEIDFKIIIIIDDIDRLPDDDIRMIFQLVTAVARFPNVIYFLAFDKEVVSKALNNMQGYDGERYLEKIIQVPVQIPEIRTIDILKLMEEGINKIIKSYPKMIIEKEHLWQVLVLCIPKYINNLRDIIRLFNALEIKMKMVGEDINFPDMLAITLIETKIPDVYRWIKHHKDLLVDSILADIYFESMDLNDKRNTYLNLISKFRPDDKEDILALLSCLFPALDKRCNSSPLHDVNMFTLRRIGDAKIFERYFTLDIDNTYLNRKEVLLFLEMDNMNRLSDLIQEYGKQGRLEEFLLEIDEQSLTKERANYIVSVLLDNYNLFHTTKESKHDAFKPDLEMIYYFKCNALINIIADYEKHMMLEEKMRALIDM